LQPLHRFIVTFRDFGLIGPTSFSAEWELGVIEMMANEARALPKRISWFMKMIPLQPYPVQPVSSG
jgi:hypothetical protein